MGNEVKTAIAIFDHFFERYKEELLDDVTEFMPMVKNILDGVTAVSKNPEKAKSQILEHIESRYVLSWDKFRGRSQGSI